MELRCPACGATTAVPDDRLPPEGARARCHACGAVSAFLRGGLVADDPTPPRGMPAYDPAAADQEASEEAALAASFREALEAAARAGATATGSTNGWLLRTARGDEGPLTSDDVRSRIREGKLGPDDLACPPGATDWMRAGDLPALKRWFSLLQASHATNGAAGAGATGAPAGAAASDGDVAACSRHPGVRGRWMCGGCGHLACDACVLDEEIARVRVKLCPACRKTCTEFTPTRPITPFWEDLPQVLSYPVRGLGWLALVIFPLMGVGAVLCRAAGAAFALARLGEAFFVLSIYAYHLYVIRDTTRGGRSMPNLASVEDYIDDLLKPAGKAALVSLLLFLPAGWAWNGVRSAQLELGLAQGHLAAVASDRDAAERRAADPDAAEGDDGIGEADLSLEEALKHLGEADAMSAQDAGQVMGEALGSLDVREDRDLAAEEAEAQRAISEASGRLLTRRVVHGVLLAAALGIWPMFLIIVALFNTVIPALQPQLLLRLIGEIPRPYAWCTLLTSACFIGIFLLNLPLRGHLVIGSWLTSPATYYLSCVAFHVMGRTAEMAEREIDWS